MAYPADCCNIFQFFEHFVYYIKGQKVSPSVRELCAYLKKWQYINKVARTVGCVAPGQFLLHFLLLSLSVWVNSVYIVVLFLPCKLLVWDHTSHCSTEAYLKFLLHFYYCLFISLTWVAWTTPRGDGVPLSALAPPLSIHFLMFCSLLLFPFSFLIYFTYFLLLSIRSLSTRIAPLRFQAIYNRGQPNVV